MPNNNMYGAPAVLGDMGHPYSTDEQASPSYEGSAPYTLPPPPPPYCQSPSSSSTSSSSHPANEDMSGPAPMMYLGPDQLPQIIQHYGPPYYGPPPDYKRVSNRGPLRKGKWTHEEEEYAHYIIENFNKGLIDLPRGTTLRSYLSEMLNCDPMRVTKKFSGTSCIGKSVFCPIEPTPENMEAIKNVGRHLADLHKRFMRKVETTSGPSGIDIILRSVGRQWLAPIPVSKYNMNYAMAPQGTENEAYMANNNNYYPPQTYNPYPQPPYDEQEMEGQDEEYSEQQSMTHMLPPPPRSSRRGHHAHASNRSSRRTSLPRPTRRPYPGCAEEEEEEEQEREQDPKEEEATGDEPPMDDQDAGDLLVNFFASVRKNEEGPDKGKAPASKRVKVDSDDIIEC